jgi:hypothetical protein
MTLQQTFATFSLILLLSACASEDREASPIETSAATLFPLEVGQYWVYEIRLGEEKALVENHIAGSQTIDGTEWFLSVEYGEKFWIRNSEEGQVEAVNLYTKSEHAAVFEQLDAKTLREELLFKFPARPGDSWITLENVLRYEGIKTYTVPAGTFECHHYSITQYGVAYSRSCIAEGIGIVYSDNLDASGEWEISRLTHWGKR